MNVKEILSFFYHNFPQIEADYDGSSIYICNCFDTLGQPLYITDFEGLNDRLLNDIGESYTLKSAGAIEQMISIQKSVLCRLTSVLKNNLDGMATLGDQDDKLLDDIDELVQSVRALQGSIVDGVIVITEEHRHRSVLKDQLASEYI